MEHEDNSYQKYRFEKAGETYSIGYSYRKYIWRMLFAAIALLKVSMLYMASEHKVYRLFQVLQMKDIPKMGPMFFKNFLNTKVPSDYVVQYPLIALMVFLFGYIIWWVLVLKTTRVSIDYRYITLKSGVFNTSTEPIELTKVRDQALSTPWYDRILKISNLLIISKDERQPNLLLSGLDSKEAESFLLYIRENNFQNYTDYRIVKDKRQAEKGSHRKDDDEVVITSQDDDGDGSGQ